MSTNSDISLMAMNLFDSYDKDNSGYLERNEVKEILTTVFAEVQKDYNIDEAKMNKMFSACDTNSDNKLSRKEFTKIVGLFLEPVYL